MGRRKQADIDAENKLWRKYSRTRSIELRNQLVELYMPMARRIADRFCFTNPYVNADEVYGSACLGLITAVESFDPKRGYRFSTHAPHRMRGQIIDDMRAMMPRGHRRKNQGPPPKIHSLVTLETPLPQFENDSSKTCEPHCLAVDDDPKMSELEYELEFWNQLSARTQRLLQLRFEENLTMKRIGKILGISESRVSQMLSQLLAELRKTSQYARAA